MTHVNSHDSSGATGQMVEMLLQARADVGQRRNDPEVAGPRWPEGRYDPWMPQNQWGTYRGSKESKYQ